MLSPPVGVEEEQATPQEERGPLTVVNWTGILVKGASTLVPFCVQLQEAIALPEDSLIIAVGELPCKVAMNDALLTCHVPVGQLKAGKTVIRILHETGDQRIELPVTTPIGDTANNPGLLCSVVDLVAVAYPEEEQKGEIIQIRGNSLAAISTAEEYHAAQQQLPNDPGHFVAILVTKSHPSDFASVFVFGLKGGTARLDRYECAEANLEHRNKWDYIDTCQLGEVAVSAQGPLTIVTLADGVEFCFEPRAHKRAFVANLHVGPMIFAAISLLGDDWIQWFSKSWVPALAIGNPNMETGMIERFAAPTISYLVKTVPAFDQRVVQRQREFEGSPSRRSPRAASPTSPSPTRQMGSPVARPTSPHVVAPFSPETRLSRGGPMGPKPTSGSRTRVRKCILTHSAPEMLLFNRGMMVESKFPKRVANLNMSSDVARALKHDR
jgi:hypothetical protein